MRLLIGVFFLVVRVKGGKERAHDEGCVGTSWVVSRGGVLTFFGRFFFLPPLGVRVKGRKERPQDEGCVCRSRVASKRGVMQPSQGWRVEPLEWCCPFCVCGWLLWVLCPDGCRQVEESKKGGVAWEQEVGGRCCGSGVPCEWPGVG